VDGDPRLCSVQAMTEKAYCQEQAKLMADLITILGGMPPAFREARMKVVDALRRA